MSYVWSKCRKEDFLLRPYSKDNPRCLCKRELRLNDEHITWTVWPQTPIYIRELMIEVKLFIVNRPNFPSILADGFKHDMCMKLRSIQATLQMGSALYDQLDLLYSMVYNLYTENEIKLVPGRTTPTKFAYDW